MQRVVKGIPQTLVLPTSLAATSGTVTITRDRDGASVVSAASVTTTASSVSYTLAGQTAEANLTAVWTLATASGAMTISEPVEVVSFASVSLAEIRTRRPLDDANRYPDALLLAARTQLEDELSDAAGVSFVGNEFTVRLDAPHGNELFLPVGRPKSLTGVSINGVALSDAEVADIIVDTRAGSLYKRWGWTAYGVDGWYRGRLNITVTGIAGFDRPVGGLSSAMAKGVRYMVVDSPTQDRAISVSSEDGTTQNMMVAGLRGAIFAIPELNMIAQANSTTFGVA